MIRNKRRLGRKMIVAVILFLVFSVFYLLISPYLHDEVGEGNDIQVSATAPASESESTAAAAEVDLSLMHIFKAFPYINDKKITVSYRNGDCVYKIYV